MPATLPPASARPLLAKWKLPGFIRFLGANMLFGMAIGTALSSTMVLTNTAGLKDLISGDSNPYLAIFMFSFMFALTFASVAMGVAIMTMSKTGPNRNDDPNRHDDIEPPPLK